MSINVENQSLPTLKEWVKMLGIKGLSTARKPELIEILSPLSEKIERALALREEKPSDVPEAAEDTRSEIASTSAAETADAEISGVPDEEKPLSLRRKYNNINFSSNTSGPRTARGGFGTYAPSYRSQSDDSRVRGTEKPVARDDYSRSYGRSFGTEERAPRIEAGSRSEQGTGRPVYPGRQGYGAYRQNNESARPATQPRSETAGSGSTVYSGPGGFGTYRNRDMQDTNRGNGYGAENLRGLKEENTYPETDRSTEISAEESGARVFHGVLEIMTDSNYGFIRSENSGSGDDDVHVGQQILKQYSLRTGDVLDGFAITKASEKCATVSRLKLINGEPVELVNSRKRFEEMTPIFPYERIRVEIGRDNISNRLLDLMAPIGKGQRGMIVSPPKAGKTTLIKSIAAAVRQNHPEIHIMILLIDERPEEVTDIRESIGGENVEVIYSTFDETAEHHKKMAEITLARAQRLVECGKDVMILLDSLTRLSRAYNLTVAPSGRTLSGGLDPAALHFPKKFFGSARKMREGGSLTILATALVETGSRMDDMIFEEFKGTGNMELVLDRKMSERRIFPAIDLLKSGTRRDDLLQDAEEQAVTEAIRRSISDDRLAEKVTSDVIDLVRHTDTNAQFLALATKMDFMK